MCQIFFESKTIQIEEITKMNLTGDNINNALLAVCSAHAPDQKVQVDMITYLVSKGADVNTTDKNGVTPLHRAVRFRSLEAVRTILELGGNVNSQDKKSQSTPLHRAVTNSGAPATKGKGDEVNKIIKILISSGADQTIKNKAGKIPLDYIKDDEIRSLFTLS